MPSEIGIYGDIVLFGLSVRVESGSRHALDIALSLYADRNEKADGGPSIYIVLQSYGVNPLAEERHRVEGTQLAIGREGVFINADGADRRGRCEFFEGAADDLLAEMINTLVLFLVAQAGRIPLHASAVMLHGVAVVFAGRSGAGKSTLALAASHAGLPVLSDDTIYIQTTPRLRVWSLGGPIHVFQKDAPAGAEGGLRLRAGRIKKILSNPAPCQSADRAVVCVLARGETASLEPMTLAQAVKALSADPEPGYDFYGARSVAAAQALAEGGAWQLTLSHEPREAIALLREKLRPAGSRGGSTFHARYLALISEIERRIPVALWRHGDLDLWPLVRFDLYDAMVLSDRGIGPPRARMWPLRVPARLLKPLTNLWRSRHDLSHQILWPKQADAVFLGDGVSLDWTARGYEDRSAAPLIAGLEARQQTIFVMQSGDLSRLPWRRPTFAANMMEAWGWLIAPAFARPIALPGHAEMLELLAAHGVPTTSLSRAALGRRARLASATAFLFQRVLMRVKPKLAFVVSHYAGLGPAFVLACRRLGIFCINLQHAPLEGAPMAYAPFAARPVRGYASLPDLFWTWTVQDAAHITQAMGGLASGGGFHGGHLQAAPFLDDQDALSQAWDKEFSGEFEREILVALQPLPGYREIWEALSRQIETSPPNWRWWIRRHPASRPYQDAEFGALLRLKSSAVIIEAASRYPLPAFLRRASAVVSLCSGVAKEASAFGVPALFLAEEARGPFAALLDQGHGVVLAADAVNDAIAALPPLPVRPAQSRAPSIAESLARLNCLAAAHNGRATPPLMEGIKPRPG